jgi:origin recognition complex subunit 1
LATALNDAWRGLSCEEQVQVEDNETIRRSKNWKRAFKDVIDKLGLSAAFEDPSVRGIQLTGHEIEQQKIMTFLRSRISGTVDEDGSVDCKVATNACLFVAGPPVTGKTATVHSVITTLRQEQAKGKLPAFEFVSLTGMEGRDGECRKKSQVVVLLLDEIDYLLTKKQTVLYNFFDWPRRSSENGGRPRLIVIGISNTLNLPSRLKPSVQSRLGSETCGYNSYNVKDMAAILKSKVQSDAGVSANMALLTLVSV